MKLGLEVWDKFATNEVHWLWPLTMLLNHKGFIYLFIIFCAFLMCALLLGKDKIILFKIFLKGLGFLFWVKLVD